MHRSSIGIVRSIRHVSLVRNWAHARRGGELPHYSDFQPDERAGDAADMLIAELKRDGGHVSFHCQLAGERVEKIFDRRMQGHQVRDSIDRRIVVASRPIWSACLSQRMPIYSVLPVIDRDGHPVTIEQIYLPYRQETAEVDVVVAAFHAWSTEGRFVLEGLLANLPESLSFPFNTIDPALRETGDNDSRIESI